MNAVPRLLVFRPASLGDTLVSLPAFRLIQKAYPGSPVTVLTAVPASRKSVAMETLLLPLGLIHKVIHYSPGDHFSLGKQLRRKSYDQVIYLAEARSYGVSLRDTLFFRACGIRKMIGVPWGRHLRFQLQKTDAGLVQPEAERLVRRLESLGGMEVSHPAAYQLGLGSVFTEKAAKILEQGGINEPYLVVSMGTKLPLNHWGAERWHDLLSKLSVTLPSLSLVAMGSADEAEAHEQLLSGWKSKRLNLCGQTDPWLSAAILHAAQLYLGHDSGPMHLAAAAGTRCVVIFSAHNPPGQWYPLGTGHVPLYPHLPYVKKKRNDPVYQREAMATITVEEVLAAIHNRLR